MSGESNFEALHATGWTRQWTAGPGGVEMSVPKGHCCVSCEDERCLLPDRMEV